MTSCSRLGVAGVALALVFALAGCADGPPATRPAPDVAPDAYRLGSGDRVRIDVFGEESLSGERSVDGTGMIAAPLVGAVPAEGLTTADLGSELETRLADFVRDPDVTVQVVSFRPFYIVGEVQQPGSYAYVEGMTAINAVAMGGGYTYRARKGDFVLQRRDLGEPLVAEAATPVLPGDVITVRERYF
ncbi:MAG: polysaccharide biosynthesis/export family protein [Sneathiellaceae bacterium]